MPTFIDLAGVRFGRLVVLKRGPDRYPPSGRPQTSWVCKCDCGSGVVVATQALRKGLTQSCGCLYRETRGPMLRHGHMRRGKATLTYNTWMQMRDRCRNPNAPSYHRYGGRGVSVCERWNSFENFLADMGERPADRTIDRWPDKNGNYEPGNCRWATKKEQAANRNPRPGYNE